MTIRPQRIFLLIVLACAVPLGCADGGRPTPPTPAADSPADSPDAVDQAETPDAVASLIASLSDPSAEVRAGAAQGLGAMGEPAKPAADKLAALLADDDPTVRRQAVSALGAIRPGPEVMIPLVSTEGEIRILQQLAERVVQLVMAEAGVEVDYMIGTMIELPRACIVADQIAEWAEFFSFGTNDLTQTAFGFSRDDIEGKFLPQYIEQRIFEGSPFAVIDEDGVGALVEMGVQKGREARPGMEIGICGEHGGDPRSIGFCHSVGLDYVSCSPLRVPIARLAAAQAQIENPRD